MQIENHIKATGIIYKYVYYIAFLLLTLTAIISQPDDNFFLLTFISVTKHKPSKTIYKFNSTNKNMNEWNEKYK